MSMTSTYELVARSRDGKLLSRRVQASDARAASAQATQSGLQVLRCEAVGASSAARTRHAAGSRLDVATFAQELASLVAAGLSVVDALRTLASKERGGPRKALLCGVAEGVSEGLPLSAALARHPQSFPSLLIATVSASEQTGDLRTSLTRYAEHQSSFKALRDKVVGATIYPIALLVVGSVVVVFLLGVVVPRFAMLIESAHKELPWSSQLLMSWGHLVASHPVIVALAVSALLIALASLARQTLRNGARSRWVERLPVIGPNVRQFRHAQLYRTTGMLVQGGVAAPRALQLAGSLLGSDDQRRLQQAIGLIREGRSFSAAMQAAQLGDEIAVSMLSVAERTGALAEILERIAQFHESRLQRSIELTSRLFEPVLMIVIGLVIGAIVVLMYLPIFDLASSLQ